MKRINSKLNVTLYMNSVEKETAKAILVNFPVRWYEKTYNRSFWPKISREKCRKRYYYMRLVVHFKIGNGKRLRRNANEFQNHIIIRTAADGEVTEQELTYDLVFNSDTDSMHEGFRVSVEDCKHYIDVWNGTNHSYFEDFKGGTVFIRCNETAEVVYEEEVR